MTEPIRKMWSDDEGQDLVEYIHHRHSVTQNSAAVEKLANIERALRKLRACRLRSLGVDLEAERVRAARIRYLAAITLAGLICGGIVLAVRGRSSPIDPAKTKPSTASESSQATVSPSAATAPSVLSPPAVPAVSSPIVDAQPRTVLSEVLPGITYEHGQNFARLFMDVPGNLRLRAIALKNPDRIYFDVPNSGTRVRHKSVDLNNEFVRRIRVLPTGGGDTRVVLSSPRHGVEIDIRPRSAAIRRLHIKPVS